MRYYPPHEVRDEDKLASMIKMLETGGELPSILVCGDYALSGSHRLAAWDEMEIDPRDYAVELTEEEYLDIKEHLNIPADEDVEDYEEFLEAARELGLAGDAK